MENTITITTEDGATATKGDRLYNYYDMKPGTIGRMEHDGWFEFNHEDGTRSFLNGQRVCTIAFAARKGWV